MIKNKLLLFVILSICVAPAFATGEPDVDILAGASDVSCDSGVLQTSSGSSTLEADWSANTVTVKFYNGDSLYSSKTCQYDGALTLPEINPTKDGYTFAGWRVKAASGFNLAAWNYGAASEIGYSSWNRDISTVSSNESTYGLNVGEWATEFDNGVVKGVATCVTTTGDNHNGEYGGESSDWLLPADELQAGQYNTDSNSGSKNCWCQANGYAPHNNNGTYSEYVPVSTSSWIFASSGSPNMCKLVCPMVCASAVQSSLNYRSALFGIPIPTLNTFYESGDIDTWYSIDPSGYTCRGLSDGNDASLPVNTRYCSDMDGRYSDLNKGEWKAEMPSGNVVKGTYVCSTTSGDNHNKIWGGNSSDWLSSDTPAGVGDERYFCWCKLTFVDSGNGYLNVTSSWIFNDDIINSNECVHNCSSYCAEYFSEYDGFRRALFGISE